MNWGNAIVRKISTAGSTGKVTHLELELYMAGGVRKTEKKVTWLSTKGQTLVPVELVDFDHLFNKDSLSEDDILEDVLNLNTELRVSGLADCNVSEVNIGDILQFDRKGFYRVDQVPAPGIPGVFFTKAADQLGKPHTPEKIRMGSTHIKQNPGSKIQYTVYNLGN
ncbi:unnamed protein product [Penicillium palitans]